MAHDLGLVIAKSIHGLTAAGVAPLDIVRQAALFGARNRDGWDTGLTVLTALGNLLPSLPEEETQLALFHGIRRVAADCDGQPPRRERAPLTSRSDLVTLKRWLRRWTAVRHREAVERTLLTAIATGASPSAFAKLMFAAETDRVFADGGHSLDFINKAFECLDLIGWEYASTILPSVAGQMVAARGTEESTAWRQPVDLVALLNETFSELAVQFAVRHDDGPWRDYAALAHALLAEDPKSVVGALKRRDRRGSVTGRSGTRPRLCRSIARCAVWHGERTRRLGDSAPRIHLLQCAAPGPQANWQRTGQRERICRSRARNIPRRHGPLSRALS
jgi:hypothetical protein